MRTLMLILVLASVARAQTDTGFYKPTLVAVDSAAVQEIGNMYQHYRTESLYCVTRWNERDMGDYLLVSVLAVEQEQVVTTATETKITDQSCRRGGQPLPTIHTHPIGQCQASPNDRRNFGSRHARFDGVVCGPMQFVWYFAEQINAIEYAHMVGAIPPRQ